MPAPSKSPEHSGSRYLFWILLDPVHACWAVRAVVLLQAITWRSMSINLHVGAAHSSVGRVCRAVRVCAVWLCVTVCALLYDNCAARVGVGECKFSRKKWPLYRLTHRFILNSENCCSFSFLSIEWAENIYLSQSGSVLHFPSGDKALLSEEENDRFWILAWRCTKERGSCVSYLSALCFAYHGNV